MRAVFLLIIALLLAGCAAKNDTTTSQNSSAPASQPEAAKAGKPAETNKSATSDTNAPPVNFTFLGITSDKQNIAYKIKVNTDKPIEEVHLALKEMDAGGKVLMDTTLVWKNIVKSTREPIESGKTYEVQDYLYPGTTKAECTLKEVIFKDGTRWTAK